MTTQGGTATAGGDRDGSAQVVGDDRGDERDVMVVQAPLRHASAKTTLDAYAHLWPDKDDSTRAAIAAAMAAREDKTRTAGGSES